MTIREELNSIYMDVIPALARAAASDGAIGLRMQNYSCPFVPYVGEDYETDAHRVVIVGKATCGWDRPGVANLADFCRQGIPLDFLGWSAEFVHREIIPFYSGGTGYKSLFWQRIYLMVSAVLEGSNELNDTRSPARATKCFGSLAWTNVFKVGGVYGNPDSRMENFLCKESWRSLLLQELQILKPELVLFSTHNGYDRFLKQMLPEIELLEPESDMSAIRLPGLGFRGFRTLHFQNRRFNPKLLLQSIRAREVTHQEC